MSEFSMTRTAHPDGSITLVLGGPLTIETCSELHRAVTESLDESHQVVLNLQAVESIDMTGMQVICSGCATAASMGRGFECGLDSIPGCMTVFGSSIGGPQGLPCGQNNNKPCIWYGGVR